MSETVEIPHELAEELADHHKEAARYFYKKNSTENGDRNHAWARKLNDATGRDWDEVAE